MDMAGAIRRDGNRVQVGRAVDTKPIATNIQAFLPAICAGMRHRVQRYGRVQTCTQ
jgi:hypothetical protein